MALTQAELASAVGVSMRTIQHWEQPDSDVSGPSAKNLRRLSEITGAPVAWLLHGEAA